GQWAPVTNEASSDKRKCGAPRRKVLRRHTVPPKGWLGAPEFCWTDGGTATTTINFRNVGDGADELGSRLPTPASVRRRKDRGVSFCGGGMTPLFPFGHKLRCPIREPADGQRRRLLDLRS